MFARRYLDRLERVMHPILRHGSRFWLAAQVAVFILIAVGAAALVAAMDLIRPGGHGEQWLASASVGFVVVGSMVSWVAFVGRALGFHRPKWSNPHYRRRNQGRCVECGYDIRWQFDHGCPECGWNRRAAR